MTAPDSHRVSLTPIARAAELCRQSEALRLVYEKLRVRYSQIHDEETRDRGQTQQVGARSAQARDEFRRLVEEGRGHPGGDKAGASPNS